MAKAVALFEGGIHERVQRAIREDGAVFARHQRRDPRYGYRWTAWRFDNERLGDNAMAATTSMSAGFSNLYRKDGEEKHVRLP